MQGCFVKVFGADFMGLHAKPDAEAFQAVLRDIGAEPCDCAMFEDSLKNLKTVGHYTLSPAKLTFSSVSLMYLSEMLYR